MGERGSQSPRTASHLGEELDTRQQPGSGLRGHFAGAKVATIYSPGPKDQIEFRRVGGIIHAYQTADRYFSSVRLVRALKGRIPLELRQLWSTCDTVKQGDSTASTPQRSPTAGADVKLKLVDPSGKNFPISTGQFSPAAIENNTLRRAGFEDSDSFKLHHFRCGL